MDAKEELKRRHDLSLRQMMRPEKDSGVPYSASKRPDIYETPKITPWDQKEPTSKYHVESEMEEALQKNLEQAQKKKLAREEKSTQAEGKKRPDIEGQKKYEDEQRKLAEADKLRRDNFKEKDEVIISKSKVKGKISKVSIVAKKHVLPKPDHRDKTDGVSEKNKMNVKVTSDKKGNYEMEVERQKNLEQTQKKKLAREEKRLQAEEQKRPAIEDKKKYQKEEKKLAEADKLRRDNIKEKDEAIISKSKVKGKISKVSIVAKKHVLPKPDRRHKTDGVSEKNKMNVKVTPDKKGDYEIEEERQKNLEQAHKKKLAREEKRLQAEEKKKPAIEDKKKYEEKQKKLADADKLSRDNFKEKDKVITSKSKVKGKISKVSIVAKKHVLAKSDHRHKTVGVSEKNKINVKVTPAKHGDDEVIENAVSESITDLKGKFKGRRKVKEEKITPELKHEYKKRLREEKEKAMLNKELRQGNASKKTPGASDEVKVSMSKIKDSLKKKESSIQDILTIKHGKKKSKTLVQSAIALGKTSEIQKLQAEYLREKAATLNTSQKTQLKDEAEVPKAKEEAEHKAKRNSDEEFVTLKQAANLGPSDIHANAVIIHKCNHQHSGKKSPSCHLCLNSELELEVLSLDYKKNLTADKTDIIIGEKIFKYKPRVEKIKEPEGVPILFQKEFRVESDQQLNQIEQIFPQETKPEQKILLSKIEMEPGKGVLHYALSDHTFIDKGWTMLPTEKVVRKMNVYRMRPAHPEFDWFKHNKNKRLTYDNGERLAEFDENGRGRLYYKTGRLALDYYDAKETNTQQRFVIYSSGEPDERGRTHPITILATFDYLGNGIVFDHTGKIRLKYNQTEGVMLDRGIGPVSHWQWHSLNDPPVLQKVMIDTKIAHKDPNILKLGSAVETSTPLDNEEMLAIEFDNFIKEKNKKLSQKFKPFQIRMKALKINEHFSLKVLDQATVYLIFRDGSTNLKLNIGMVLDHQEIVDTYTAEMGEVSNSLERFPARTDSLAGLQRTVAYARRYERQRAERERRFRPPEPCASADHLTAAASPPMRLPLRTVPTITSSSTGYRCRKPTNNLYYDTRLRY